MDTSSIREIDGFLQKVTEILKNIPQQVQPTSDGLPIKWTLLSETQELRIKHYNLKLEGFIFCYDNFLLYLFYFLIR
jgi:hypothetical protein